MTKFQTRLNRVLSETIEKLDKLKIEAFVQHRALYYSMLALKELKNIATMKLADFQLETLKNFDVCANIAIQQANLDDVHPLVNTVELIRVLSNMLVQIKDLSLGNDYFAWKKEVDESTVRLIVRVIQLVKLLRPGFELIDLEK